MFLPDYKHKGRGAKPQRLILLFKHLTSRANQAMNSWNMESKATRMNVDLLHENTAAQNGRTFTPGAAVVEGHHHFCEAPKEGMMEMAPAALPGAGLSHRAGQGCKAAPLPTWLQHSLLGPAWAVEDAQCGPSPAQHGLFTWGRELIKEP